MAQELHVRAQEDAFGKAGAKFVAVWAFRDFAQVLHILFMGSRVDQGAIKTDNDQFVQEALSDRVK